LLRNEIPIIHYSARVNRWIPARRFFCGDFPFFAPQKNQKNTEKDWDLCKNCSASESWTLG
jgi:hypothetical protein